MRGRPSCTHMKDETQWFAECRWGVFCHWLGAPPSSDGGAELDAAAWNRRVDALDVEGQAAQFAGVRKPRSTVKTIGQ